MLQNNQMSVQNIRLTAIVILALGLLLIPLTAMQFTAEVNWTLLDFIVAGLLLMSTGLGIEFMLRKVSKTGHRILLFTLIMFALFLVWAELAVGIFGTPLAGS